MLQRYSPLVVAVLGVVSGLVSSGCSSGKSVTKIQSPAWPSAGQQAPADSPVVEPDGQKPKVDRMDANAQDPLKHKAESYANEIAPYVAARNANRTSIGAPQSPAPTPSAAPSAVAPNAGGNSLINPGDFRLGSSYPTPSAPENPNQIRINSAPVSANQPGEARSASEKVDPNAQNGVTVDSAPNAPLTGTRPISSTAITTDALADKLAHRVKDYPRDVSGQLEYQLLQFLRDEPTPQLAVLSTLPSEDRELVTAVLDGLANFRNALRADNNMLLSRKIKPLLDMSERLRSQADLTIPTIALCKSVTTFGSYEPIEPARFAANEDHQVIVYCEIANFTSNLTDKQMWETRLNWDMTLFTEAGVQVWSDKTETIVDNARVRRHDFFVRKAITLPRNLTIGRYLLKASLVDTQSNRVAEATTPIVIAAQGTQP